MFSQVDPLLILCAFSVSLFFDLAYFLIFLILQLPSLLRNQNMN
jgi:hypothetical protein